LLKTLHEKTQWEKTHQGKKEYNNWCSSLVFRTDLWFSGSVSPWTLQLFKPPHANSINAFIEAGGR
jgi:hypothetical protein